MESANMKALIVFAAPALLALACGTAQAQTNKAANPRPAAPVEEKSIASKGKRQLDAMEAGRRERDRDPMRWLREQDRLKSGKGR
jgi:hypothetical protein